MWHMAGWDILLLEGFLSSSKDVLQVLETSGLERREQVTDYKQTV